MADAHVPSPRSDRDLASMGEARALARRARAAHLQYAEFSPERIDAVFDDDTRPQVVEWQTGRAQTANPLQLSVYRLAWAELHGLAVEEVDAVFHDVAGGRTVRPTGLLDRAGLEKLVGRLAGDR